MAHAARHGDRAGAPPVLVPPSLSRRSVLKRLGLGGATLLVAGSGAVSYRAFDNGVLEAGSGTPYDAWSQWREDPGPVGAVAVAILAANPHNTQPWQFDVRAGRVDVFADVTRGMPAVDPFAREHDVGMGCALENLVLGLQARGFATVVTLMPTSQDPTHKAEVLITDGPASNSPLYEAVGDRHSNRGPYRAQPVEQSVLDELADYAVDLDGVAVAWLVTETDRAALGALIVAATEEFIADPGQSRESFSWFRNSREDIETHRDGPTLDAQGLAPVVSTLAKLLPASSRTAGDTFWLGQTRTVHTATAAAYGVITLTDPDDVRTRLNGGRLLQRIHLAATAAGLGLQHMNQITERIDRERQQRRPATFAPKFQEFLDGAVRLPLVAFRLGHPVRTALASPRRALSEVTR